MNSPRWIFFWFAEILIPALVSLGFVVLLCVYFYVRTGQPISVRGAGGSFLGMWLPFVLFYSRSVVVKLQIWKRLCGLPHKDRTLEEARAILRICLERRLWRIPKTSVD